MSNTEIIFQTPGVGGALACVVIVALVVCYGFTLRWISRGREDQTGEPPR